MLQGVNFQPLMSWANIHEDFFCGSSLPSFDLSSTADEIAIFASWEPLGLELLRFPRAHRLLLITADLRTSREFALFVLNCNDVQAVIHLFGSLLVQLRETGGFGSKLDGVNGAHGSLWHTLLFCEAFDDNSTSLEQ